MKILKGGVVGVKGVKGAKRVVERGGAGLGLGYWEVWMK